MSWLILGSMLAALAPASAACLPVAGERILAADMARALPTFAAMAPELSLGFAPPPGARRTYNAPELARLARRYGLTVEPGVEACFIRPAETLTRERVEGALRTALPAARIEVVEFSRQPVPPGELRFLPAGLPLDPSAQAPLLWRGMVSAAGRDDFPVWAKVRVQVTARRVVSLEALAAGRPIAASELREESYQGTPGLPDLSQVTGWIPRRPIPAGTVIERQWLDAPADVVRGESVRLEIRSGQAVVLMDGQAQSSGRRGGIVGIRNPANGRILRATVVERGRALILTGSPTVPPDVGGKR